jgi:large subunit ribosomal protein L17
VVGKLFSEIGPRYLERAGGYTRIIQMPLRRLGDNGQLVILQLVGENDKRVKKSKSHSKVKQLDKVAEPVVEETTKAVEATEEQAQAAEEKPAEVAPEADVSEEEEKK